MNGELRTEHPLALLSARILDYLRLAKPELTLLSVITAVGSSYLALPEGSRYFPLLHVFIGTLLTGGACGILNEFIERTFDVLMKRTERRPIPAGRVNPGDALIFGIASAMAGIVYLALFTTLSAALLAFVTLATYLFVYTPMKRTTPFATILGGIPGALPPLIGWVAVRGTLTMEAWSLFFILFFWQMPHFLSLAWLYRRDYERAGFRMLTVVDPSGSTARRQILVYLTALIPAAVMPTLVGMTGIIYFTGAVTLSVIFLVFGLRLYPDISTSGTRRLFYASLIYIPVIFLLLMVDRVPLP